MIARRAGVLGSLLMAAAARRGFCSFLIGLPLTAVYRKEPLDVQERFCAKGQS